MVDTGVLLAGTIWPRFSYEVLRHAIRGNYRLVLCPFVVAQARRKFAEKFPRLAGEFEEFLQASRYDEVPDPSPEEVRANAELVRDITDVPIALAGIAAGVDYLVSEDKDFTARDATTERLRQRLRVLLPGTFLREVMGWTGEELEAIRRREWSDRIEE